MISQLINLGAFASIPQVYQGIEDLLVDGIHKDVLRGI